MIKSASKILCCLFLFSFFLTTANNNVVLAERELVVAPINPSVNQDFNITLIGCNKGSNFELGYLVGADKKPIKKDILPSDQTTTNASYRFSKEGTYIIYASCTDDANQTNMITQEITLGTSKPNKPTGLSASGVSTSEIEAKWNTNTDSVASYQVWYNKDRSDLNGWIKVTPPSGTSIKISSLDLNTSYYIHVNACNSTNICSDPSDDVLAKTDADDATAGTCGLKIGLPAVCFGIPLIPATAAPACLAGLNTNDCKSGFEPQGLPTGCKCRIAAAIVASGGTATPTPLCTPGAKNCSSSAGTPCGDPTNNPGVITAIGCIHTQPIEFIKDFLKFAVGIAGGIAFLFMLFGVFQMITSAGNPDTLKNGSAMFTNAIIGLLFIIFSVLLLKIIGVDILGLGAQFGP